MLPSVTAESMTLLRKGADERGFAGRDPLDSVHLAADRILADHHALAVLFTFKWSLGRSRGLVGQIVSLSYRLRDEVAIQYREALGQGEV